MLFTSVAITEDSFTNDINSSCCFSNNRSVAELFLSLNLPRDMKMMTGHKGRPFKGFVLPSTVHNIFCMWSVSTFH